MKVSADDKCLFSFADGKIFKLAFFHVLIYWITYARVRFIYGKLYHIDIRPLNIANKTFKGDFTPPHDHVYSNLKTFLRKSLWPVQ